MSDTGRISCLRSRTYSPSSSTGRCAHLLYISADLACCRRKACCPFCNQWNMAYRHQAQGKGHRTLADGWCDSAEFRKAGAGATIHASQRDQGWRGHEGQNRSLINAGFQADLSGLQGTISRFIDKAIFINVSGSVDGVVWPLHYADIQLKHPEKRFKAGNTVKCRVSPGNRRQKSLPDVGVSAVASRSSPSSRKRAVSSSR